MGNFHRATHKSKLDESERQDFPDTPTLFILKCQGLRPRRATQAFAMTLFGMLASATQTASAPGIIAAQWLAFTSPCRRFAGILTDACARFGSMRFAIPSS
jgi:hypothetical protein